MVSRLHVFCAFLLGYQIMKNFDQKPFRVIGYNPQSLSADRLEDVATELRNFDVALLAGTQIKGNIDGGLPYEVARLHGRVRVDAGWFKDPGFNKSCGCSILLGWKFRKIIENIWAPPMPRGRGLAVRVRKGKLLFIALVVYFPVRPKNAAQRQGYFASVARLAKWAKEIEKENDCFCIAYADVNDGMGAEKGEYERVIRCENSSAVKRGNETLEHLQNGAGQLFREFLDGAGMLATNTFQNGETATWFRGRSKSTIDFLGLPEALFEAASSWGTLFRLGRRLHVREQKGN